MISFTRMDSLENQKTLAAGESDESASKNEDFASALSILASGFLANNSAANQTFDSSDTNDKTCNEVSGKISGIELSQTDVSTESTEVNQLNLSSPQNLVVNDSKDESTMSSSFQSLLRSSQNDDGQNLKFIPKDEKTISEKARALIKSCFESGVAEVVKEAEKSPFIPFLQMDFPVSEKPLLTNNKITPLPQIFKEISGAFKNKETEKLQKSDSTLENVSENKLLPDEDNFVSVKLSAIENKSTFDSNPSQIENKKAKEQIKTGTENISAAANFDKILSSSIEKKSINASAADARTEKVFEQIEPKVLQILTLKSHENEKKILKMRLHPAELGTVEIRLEKDVATGKLAAHFQAENETAKQILTQSLDQLRDSLQNSGWQIERLEISCNSFSTSTQGNARENASQGQFETIGNKPKTRSVSDNSSDDADDMKPLQSNRLLSVRA